MSNVSLIFHIVASELEGLSDNSTKINTNIDISQTEVEKTTNEDTKVVDVNDDYEETNKEQPSHGDVEGEIL